MNMYKKGLAIAVSTLLVSGAAWAINDDNDMLSDNETNLLSKNYTELLSNNSTDLLSNNVTAVWTDNSAEYTLNADIIVANSDLDGSVTGAPVYYGGGFGIPIASGAIVTTQNTIDGMTMAAGVFTVSQNAGSGSLAQQSVNINASLFVD